jgi:hypothetical protein
MNEQLAFEIKIKIDPDRKNPMIRKAGKFSNPEKCKRCKFFIQHWPGNHVYFKCLKFGLSNGAATDWRANWQACSLFQPKKEG